MLYSIAIIFFSVKLFLMSESYLVTLEIPVFSVDTINMLWVCFQFRIKEVVLRIASYPNIFKPKFKNQLRQTFYNELVVDILKWGGVGSADVKGASNLKR